MMLRFCEHMQKCSVLVGCLCVFTIEGCSHTTLTADSHPQWYKTTENGLVPIDEPPNIDKLARLPPSPRPSISATGHEIPVAAQFRTPASIFDNPWGESLPDLDARYPGLMLYTAETVEWPEKQHDVHGECIEFDAKGGCRNTQLTVGWFDGGGTEAYAEYYSRDVIYRDDETGALYWPIIWQMCAHYAGRITKTLHQDLKLCGVRLTFYAHHSWNTDPTSLGERVHAIDTKLFPQVTDTPNEERVLQAAFRDFGYPPGYEYRGLIYVYGPDGSQVPPEDKSRFVDYRWCEVADSGGVPKCPATVTLSYKPSDGWGFVEYAARPLYVYADASHENGEPQNFVFRILHGGLSHPAFTPQGSLADTCLWCRPERTGMDKRIRAMFEPKNDKKNLAALLR